MGRFVFLLYLQLDVGIWCYSIMMTIDKLAQRSLIFLFLSWCNLLIEQINFNIFYVGFSFDLYFFLASVVTSFSFQSTKVHLSNYSLLRESFVNIFYYISGRGTPEYEGKDIRYLPSPSNDRRAKRGNPAGQGASTSSEYQNDSINNNTLQAGQRPAVRRRIRRRANSASNDPAEQLTEMSVRGLNLFRYASVNEGVYQCTECAKENIQKTFKNKYSFQRHAFLYHEGQQRKVFPCPVCCKEFSRPDKMKNHMKMTHDCYVPKDCVYPPNTYFILPGLEGQLPPGIKLETVGSGSPHGSIPHSSPDPAQA